MPCTFEPTTLPGVMLIQPRIFADERGFFLEYYKQSEFSAHGVTELFVQDNHSQSTRGVLRGLHYQLPPAAQGKLVRCTRGKIWDVAVDIRKSSPTYKNWVGYLLSEENKQMLYIPPGFAHGFITLSEVAELTYKVTAEYAPKQDRGIIWNDPELAINWPLPDCQVSGKDAELPQLADAEVFA
jgi:dTDP-4-dehydrorhamnose 3,5-epimerase